MRKAIPQRELFMLLIVAVITVVAIGAVYVRENVPEWKYYQSEFGYILEENFGDVDAASVPSGIQQIWVEDLDRVDRCTTCHLGITWPGLEDLEQPWATHPDLEMFRDHPLEDYGCTICHGGQGFALTTVEAHGFIKHWEQPLLSSIIGSEYDVRNPVPMHEIQCNYCHRYERNTAGLDFINHGKNLMHQKGCKVCHIIGGDGGILGPELTNEGDKHPEGYDFSNLVSDQLTIFNWHIRHFKSPETIVPGTIMPDMNFQTRDAIALSMLVMSWKDNSDLPRDYMPGIDLQDEMTAEEIERERKMRDGDGAFFFEHSCFICHSIEAFDIESPTNKGPDLSWAPDDVRTRFNKTVEEFLFNPTGTMEIILGSQIPLTDEEKWEAVEKINRAYDIVKNRSEQNQMSSND
ncbi:MAG TPA: c-type cytochrome [Bacteroidetes bacterium]|nr:cytochrome c [bacterium BMS3Bbin04]HDO65118.1 c-type cytochrome [Bacteroidota bacterium]HEX04243.1 c-type cytochrome [Bacteroidota bacterium]